MPLKLMYLTNNIKLAQIAEKSGVDWIFVDLEINGKIQRQFNLDTVISNHKISDILLIKNVLNKAKLLVRINPLNSDSEMEINNVIKAGADIIMLPYFKTKQEIVDFISILNKRVKSCLLIETPEAVEILDDFPEIKGINYIHIGLNDLSIGYKKKFMFELLSNGTVEKIAKKIKVYDLPFGFGGIGQIGEGILPAEKILAEHYRLNSSMVILSRSFFKHDGNINYDIALKSFTEGIKKIRALEELLLYKKLDFFINNKQEIVKIVDDLLVNSKSKET